MAALSTFFGKSPTMKVNRLSKSQTKHIEVGQPYLINVYNRNMGGVDRMDQNLAAYMINHRSKKWWWPMFRFCIDLATNNAIQLYRTQVRQAGEKGLDAKGYRRAVVEAYHKYYQKRLVPKSIHRGNGAKQPVPDYTRKDSIGHLPTKGRQRRCALPGCHGTAVFECSKCGVGLHPNCFNGFLTM